MWIAISFCLFTTAPCLHLVLDQSRRPALAILSTGVHTPRCSHLDTASSDSARTTPPDLAHTSHPLQQATEPENSKLSIRTRPGDCLLTVFPHLQSPCAVPSMYTSPATTGQSRMLNTGRAHQFLSLHTLLRHPAPCVVNQPQSSRPGCPRPTRAALLPSRHGYRTLWPVEPARRVSAARCTTPQILTIRVKFVSCSFVFALQELCTYRASAIAHCPFHVQHGAAQCSVCEQIVSSHSFRARVRFAYYSRTLTSLGSPPSPCIRKN